MLFVFFFKQKTAYEMRISDWSSDVCSSDLIGVRRVGAFNEQGVLDRIQAGFQRIIGIDQCQINVWQYTWQSSRFEFTELQLLGVLDDVARGCQNIRGVFQFDQTLLLQQQQRTGAIRRVVGQSYLCAFLEVFNVFRSEEHTSELQSLMRT